MSITQQHPELQKTNKGPEKSNLSENAKYVNEIAKTYITPGLRESGLMREANEIFATPTNNKDNEIA